MSPFVVPIVAMIATAATIIGFPIARALARRMDRDAASPRVPPEVVQRLERIEQAVDSIAVEVERISEGQRFTTKLLSERVKQGAIEPSSAAAPSDSPNVPRP